MKPLLTLLLTLLFCWCNAQNNPAHIGYVLKPPVSLIIVYRDSNTKPDVSVFKIWNQGFWFKLDELTPSQKVNGRDFIRITIPVYTTYDSITKAYQPAPPHYDTEQEWKASGLSVDTTDINSWLWIAKDDFDRYKADYYRPADMLN